MQPVKWSPAWPASHEGSICQAGTGSISPLTETGSGDMEPVQVSEGSLKDFAWNEHFETEFAQKETFT